MPHMQPTRVMTLGNVGLGDIYMRPSQRTPNILYQTMTSGIGRTGRFLAGLGDAAGAIVDPTQADAAGQNAINASIADGTIKPLVGQSVPNSFAPTIGQSIPFAGAGAAGVAAGQRQALSGVRLATLGALSLVSGLFSAYHGYRRDRGSWGSAFGWFTLGSMFPIITPAVALLAKPGFAKPRGSRR